MPLYFFHLMHGDDVAHDLEGMRLPDIETAKAEAIASAREIMADAMLRGEKLGKRECQIADKTGTVLLTIRFEDAIP